MQGPSRSVLLRRAPARLRPRRPVARAHPETSIVDHLPLQRRIAENRVGRPRNLDEIAHGLTFCHRRGAFYPGDAQPPERPHFEPGLCLRQRVDHGDAAERSCSCPPFKHRAPEIDDLLWREPHRATGRSVPHGPALGERHRGEGRAIALESRRQSPYLRRDFSAKLQSARHVPRSQAFTGDNEPTGLTAPLRAAICPWLSDRSSSRRGSPAARFAASGHQPEIEDRRPA